MLPIPTKLLKAGVKRHAAPVRRAHERHQLRRLPAALRAGGACGRPAGAGATGDLITVDVPARRIHLEVERRRAGAPPRRLDTAARALRARLRLDVRKHVLQADQGCDFDFLETGFGAAGARARYLLMIDSRGDARAASAGAILVTRLMQRGAAGIVTDGGFRDSPDMAKLPFPVYHQRPAAPTNLTLHQAIDIDVPIGCGDAPVFPRDVIVGDAEGVVVIPAHLADEVAAEAVEMTAFEDFVQERVMAGQSILGLYPPTDDANRAAFDAWRSARGR
jgi:hypothetical protein